MIFLLKFLVRLCLFFESGVEVVVLVLELCNGFLACFVLLDQNAKEVLEVQTISHSLESLYLGVRFKDVVLQLGALLRVFLRQAFGKIRLIRSPLQLEPLSLKGLSDIRFLGRLIAIKCQRPTSTLHDNSRT